MRHDISDVLYSSVYLLALKLLFFPLCNVPWTLCGNALYEKSVVIIMIIIIIINTNIFLCTGSSYGLRPHKNCNTSFRQHLFSRDKRRIFRMKLFTCYFNPYT